MTGQTKKQTEKQRNRETNRETDIENYNIDKKKTLKSMIHEIIKKYLKWCKRFGVISI